MWFDINDRLIARVEVTGQAIHGGGGKRNQTILPQFTVSDEQGLPPRIEIFDLQVESFTRPQAGDEHQIKHGGKGMSPVLGLETVGGSQKLLDFLLGVDVTGDWLGFGDRPQVNLGVRVMTMKIPGKGA